MKIVLIHRLPKRVLGIPRDLQTYTLRAAELGYKASLKNWKELRLHRNYNK